jgi:hypothetical protein
LRDDQCPAQHGDVLREHDHLHLVHHGIGYGPEVVHHGRYASQEQYDQPGANFGAITEQDGEASDERERAGKRHRDGSHGHALGGGVGDGLTQEVPWPVHYKDQGEQQTT